MENKLDILMRKQREASDPVDKRYYKKQVDAIVQTCINKYRLQKELEQTNIDLILATA